MAKYDSYKLFWKCYQSLGCVETYWKWQESHRDGNTLKAPWNWHWIRQPPEIWHTKRRANHFSGTRRYKQDLRSSQTSTASKLSRTIFGGTLERATVFLSPVYTCKCMSTVHDSIVTVSLFFGPPIKASVEMQWFNDFYQFHKNSWVFIRIRTFFLVIFLVLIFCSERFDLNAFNRSERREKRCKSYYWLRNSISIFFQILIWLFFYQFFSDFLSTHYMDYRASVWDGQQLSTEWFDAIAVSTGFYTPFYSGFPAINNRKNERPQNIY